MDTVDVRMDDYGRQRQGKTERKSTNMRKRSTAWSQRRKWWAWGNIVGNYGAEETNTSNARKRENAW